MLRLQLRGLGPGSDITGTAINVDGGLSGAV